MTDASEADDQAAVPAPPPASGPRDTSDATAQGSAQGTTGPADPATTGPADSGTTGLADSGTTSPADSGATGLAGSGTTGPADPADSGPADSASTHADDATSADMSLAAAVAGATSDGATAGSGPGFLSAASGSDRATGWGVAGARTAETYLRLLAESELRAALAFPRIEPPSDRLGAPLEWAGSAIGAAVSAAEVVTRPVRPAAIRAGRAARPWAESAAKVLAPPARMLTPPARRAGAAVITAGWRARGVANWIGSRWTERNWQEDAPSARTCLNRVRAAASVLAITEALGAETAESVAGNMERALMLRRRIEDEGPFYAHLAAVRRQMTSAPPPAGPVRAIPVGATIGIEAHEERARMHLLALVLADGYATMTMVAQQAADREEPADGEDADDEADVPDLYLIIDNLKVHGVDDRGGTYRLRMDAGGGSDLLWEGQFSVTPVPPAGVRWLEITVMPGQSPVHIDIPPVSAADAGRAAGQVPASVADRAERIIDNMGQDLLSYRGDPDSAGHELPEATDQIRALHAVGALTPGSPALARLLTLIRRLGCQIPAELASAATAASVAGPGDELGEELLPEAWRTVLELDDIAGDADDTDDADDVYDVYDDTDDEPAAIAPATAVLPELDGARCVVTGVRGRADETTVKVLAWGWPHSEFGWHRPGAPQFRWLARDDAGRWHVGYENGGSYGDGATEFELTLTPPAHPEARSLELMLLGLSGEVSATLPLNWMAT